jgi:hypothetical protein
MPVSFVRPDVQQEFNQEVQERLGKTVWEAGCNSWYRTDSGRNTRAVPRTRGRRQAPPMASPDWHAHRRLGAGGSYVPGGRRIAIAAGVRETPDGT